MRPLTEEETTQIFNKLSKFIGENIQLLIDRPDGMYCFRYHRDRVYYVSEQNMKRATSVTRKHLISFGTCFGKFTKTKQFKLHVTALDYLAPYAKYKVWVKSGSEQSYLYGNHVLKSGLGRITESTEKYQGVVVYSMNDLPLEQDQTSHNEAAVKPTSTGTKSAEKRKEWKEIVNGSCRSGIQFGGHRHNDRKKSQWTTAMEISLLRETVLQNPFQFKHGSQERGRVWLTVAAALCGKCGRITLTQRSVRDKVTGIKQRQNAVDRSEERASGISPEETKEEEEIRMLVEEVKGLEEAEPCISSKEQDEEEKKKIAGIEMQRTMLERFSETRKRQGDQESNTPRKRRNASDTLGFLEKKMEIDKEMRREEATRREEEAKRRKEEERERERRFEMMQMQQQQQFQLLQQQQQQQMQQQQQQMMAMMMALTEALKK